MSAETKHEKFKRIAERRTNQVLDALRRLSNLTNRYAYEFTEEDAAAICRRIEKAVALARSHFEAELEFRNRGAEFKLD